MGTTRKLEDVHQDLARLAEQGKTVGFLANIENTQRINDLVEDIREAMLDYQVLYAKLFVSTTSNVC